MKRTGKIAAALLLVGLSFGMGGCMKEDIDEIREELQKQDERLAALEEWQKSVNTDILSLQGLIEALEGKDYVTGVTPLPDGTGYVISFQKSGDITIKHGERGEQGEKGEDGTTPVISVKQDTDGKYYWTVNGEWLLDGGKKMPVTGDKGADAIAPQVRINTDSNEWEISVDGGTTWTLTGVKATGDEGPVGPSGAACGISNIEIDGSNVIFTLGTGQDAQLISIPLCSIMLTFNNLDEITKENNKFVTENALFNQTDLVIQTRVESKSADGTDIMTRSAADRWNIATTISDNTLEITVNPTKAIALNEVALLKVTVTSKDGRLLASGQKTFTNGIFTGTLFVSSFDDLLAQLDKADKTEATNIKISGSLENNITEIQMQSLISKINGFSQIGTLEISVPQITLLSQNAFKSNTNSLKVFKSDDITALNANGGAFWKSSVEEVYLPNLQSLNQLEFQDCMNLRRVNIVNVAEVKGSSVFSGCAVLEALDLPNLTTFGMLTYSNFARNCYSLKEVNMPKVTSLPNNAFMNCYSLTYLNFPGVVELGEGVFLNCNGLSAISLPKVKVLPANTFKGCISLNAESGFGAVEEVGESAFSGCSAITWAALWNVTKIGKTAFAGCRSLNALSLGAVTSVDTSAFDGVDTESCTITFRGEPTAGNLNKTDNMWCGKKWKSIRII